MTLKPSTIIIVFSIFLVLFIGYQNSIIQRFFPNFLSSEKSEEYIPPPPPAAGEPAEYIIDSTFAYSDEYSNLDVTEGYGRGGGSATNETVGGLEAARTLIDLHSRLKLLEYRVSELEESYANSIESVQRKGRKFDDVLALLSTLMPLLVTYITVKNKEKVDTAGKRIKTLWNKK